MCVFSHSLSSSSSLSLSLSFSRSLPLAIFCVTGLQGNGCLNVLNVLNGKVYDGQVNDHPGMSRGKVKHHPWIARGPTSDHLLH